MKTKFRFTKRSVEALPLPEKLTTFHDTETPGLKLSKSPTGRITFFVDR